MRFSLKNKGFYPESINYDNLPDDLITIDNETYLIALSVDFSSIDVVNGALVIIQDSPEQILDNAKISQIATLDKSCHDQIVSGFYSSALGAQHEYPSKPNDQTNMIGLITESVLPGATDEYKFWCEDNMGNWARLIHTKLQIQEVGLAFSAHIKAQQTIYENKLSAISEATTQAALDAIVW